MLSSEEDDMKNSSEKNGEEFFESRPNQNETSRHAIPKSSGFFLRAQIVLTYTSHCQNLDPLFSSDKTKQKKEIISILVSKRGVIFWGKKLIENYFWFKKLLQKPCVLR